MRHVFFYFVFSMHFFLFRRSVKTEKKNANNKKMGKKICASTRVNKKIATFF